MQSVKVKGLIISFDWTALGEPKGLKIAAANEVNYHLSLEKSELRTLLPFVGIEVVLEVVLLKTIGENLFHAKFIKVISIENEEDSFVV